MRGNPPIRGVFGGKSWADDSLCVAREGNKRTMTPQIHDTLNLKGIPYQIVGVNGYGLPFPEDFGMTAMMMSAACYRGYVCTYTVAEDTLRLTNLIVRAMGGKYLPVGGVQPQMNREFNNGQYHNLGLHVLFRGKLLVGSGLIREMAVQVGFQKPVAYEQVVELVFDYGTLKACTDFSGWYARMREAVAPQRQPKEDLLSGWARHPFSLDYEVEL